MEGPHGRGSISEHSTRRAAEEASSMSERSPGLIRAYRRLLAGQCPSQSAADVAGVVFSGVRGPLDVPGQNTAEARCHVNSVELTCVSVTLVEMMTSLVTEGQPAEVTQYCRDTLRVLFRDMDLMTQLVHHFQTEDQIISHLAAKSVSTYVVYHLLKSATVSPVWQRKCVQAFHSCSPGAELETCLWSLTDVLKRLLKAAHQDILGKLVAAFDPSLGALCSKFLPEEKQRWMDFTSCDRWGTTFCLLLDLLEALAASSVTCGAGLKSPRLAHIHSSALLTMISCSPEYFVKKRALLLLKRTVLQKAGEDWLSGEVLSTGQRHEHLSTDMNKLAQTVLTAVAADWLQSVQVESASFFGGTRHVQEDGGQKPDCVMLRAVSLLLLKSTELHAQAAGRTAGVDSATEVYGYLQSLWGFLRRCSVKLMEVTHLCCWVSLLFGEQDDDMMEAAKASLSIFLHHRLCSRLDDIAESEAACASGCNPHCHFLFLLQSVSFDHSILLDFLISSETCFLEYFVRYLKYLKADWQGFTAACERVTKSHCHVSPQESFTFSCSGDMPYTGEPDQVEFSSCVQPSGVITPADRIGLVAGLRLVEYDSSDESDEGSMEISEDRPGPSVCEKSKCPAFDVKQKTFEAKQHESSDSAGLLSEPTSTLKIRTEGLSLPMLQSKQRWCTNMAPLSEQVTLARAVTCLSELREVVTRLQTKKLFPYNASSLLKLMEHVEKCSQQPPVSLFNKR